MATYGAASLAAACFALAFHWLGMAPVARRAIAIGLEAGRVMRDDGLDDDAKERAVQAASLTLLRLFASLAARSLGAVGLSLLPVLAAQAAGLTTVSAVNALFLSWPGAILASVVFGAAYMAGAGR